MYVLEKTFLSCETCVLSICFLLNNKNMFKVSVTVPIMTQFTFMEYLCHRRPWRYSICCSHNPIHLSSFMTTHLIFNRSNMMGSTGGAVTVYPSMVMTLLPTPHFYWGLCGSICNLLCSVLVIVQYVLQLLITPLVSSNVYCWTIQGTFKPNLLSSCSVVSEKKIFLL